MKTLVIVESPSKIKSVGGYLGAGYTVAASVGHIRDLPKKNVDAIDIEHDFKPSYEISLGKGKVVSDLIALAKKSDHILLATDPDREGEAISWHIYECLHDALGKNLPKTERISFNEITKAAVNEAVAKPRAIDQNLRRAQEARRVLDRLMGYDLSGLIWKKVRYGLSAGRVQSPALRIIMEREREIRNFVPVWYGLLSAHTTHKSGTELELSCTHEFADKNLWQSVHADAEKHNWSVNNIAVSAQKRSPRAPFTTSTLQQTASTRLGFSPGRTMRAAQKLYEQGHISYMRTDSTSLSKTALADLAATVESQFGKRYVEVKNYATKSKNAQEAHEAIRPTHSAHSSAGGTPDERALYELIWSRAVASQMIPASVEKTSIESFLNSNGNTYTFSLNGQRILELGWMRADPSARSEDVELPRVAQGDSLSLQSVDAIEKYTTPPNRYSEAGLIKELEKRGIGRPSTYASTIETLIERDYVTREGRTLFPSDTGDVVSSFLETEFGDYISDTFTAQMEDELDDIAAGTNTYERVLTAYYWPLHNEVVEKESTLTKITNLGDADVKFVCPKCGSHMIIKLGRGGRFLSCATYPDCDGALAIDGTAIRESVPIGTDTVSGLPIYVLSGKFGPYVQLGSVTEREVVTVLKNGKEKIKVEKINPRRASLPAKMKSEDVTLEIALKLLTLPRELGLFPETGNPVIANIGKFGPYVGEGRNFRSLKAGDDPYTIDLERATLLLQTPKALPRGVSEMREIGINAKTKKPVTVFQDKKGLFTKRGMKRVYIDTTKTIDKLELEDVK